MNRDLVKYEKGSIQKIEDILSIDDYLLGERSDFINRKNNGIILSTNNPIPFRRKKKWGFSSENKNVIIDCVFDSVIPFYENISIAQKNNLIIFLDKTGNTLFVRKKYNEFFYQNIIPSFIWFSRSDSPFYQGIIDVAGNEIISKTIRIQMHNEKDRIVVFKDDFNEEKKFGFFSGKNIKLVDCKYNKIKNYQNGFISVGKTVYDQKYMYGFVDINDDLIIQNKYSDVHEFSCDRAGVKIGTKWGYINSKDELIIPPIYQHVRNFNNHVAQVYKSKKWGLIDVNGDVILPTIFDSIFVENENLFGVKFNGYSGFINRNGDFVVDNIYHQIREFSNGFSPVMLNQKWGYIDNDGKLVIKHEYYHCNHFNEFGFANVVLDPHWVQQGIIDRNGCLLTPLNATRVVLWGNRFICCINDKYGCLDQDQKEIIPFIWDNIEILDNNLVKVFIENKLYGYINQNGEKFWED